MENQNATYDRYDSTENVAKDSQSDLSSSIWDEIKTQASSKAKEIGESAKELYLSFDSLYSKDASQAKELPKTAEPLDKKAVPALEKNTSADSSAPPTAEAGDKKSDAKADSKTDSKTDSKKSEKHADENVPFKGAEIKKDIEPGSHTVKPGDNLTKIAREHLGPDASKEEVQAHIKEIASLNKIKDPNIIRDGQVLQLPGHSADGGTITTNKAGDRITTWKDNTVSVEHKDNTGFVKTPDGNEIHWGPQNKDNYSVSKTADGGRQVKDFYGNTKTSWDDGVVRQENKDGTGNVRRPLEGGAYSQHNWGPKPEDNFDVIKTADGKYKIQDGEGDKTGHDPKNETERLQAEKSRLNDRMADKLKNDPEALERTKQDMKDFEKRAAEAKPPLSKEEIAKTYEQISKLLESTGEQPVSQLDRVKIAEQILHQAAHPNEISQGFHNTCNVTTVENRIYTKNPSEAARFVTEAATTGQVTMADGRVVQLPPNSLKADGQASHHPSPDGERSYASQIFQVAAINNYYDRVNKSTTPNGQIRYEQDTPTGPADTGERLWNYGTTPKSAATDAAGNVMSPPKIPTSELEKISNDISGKNEKDFVLINGKYGDANTVKFKSEAELGKKLEQMKKDGKLPAIIWVDAQNEPFFTDSGAGSNGGSGGAHVVTITDYDPKSGRVQIDNQWEQADDHPVSLHDLYLATRPSTDADTISELQSDVSWNHWFGDEDGFKEYELLRLKKNAGQMTDAEYDKAIIDTMKAQEKRWKEDGEGYPGEKARAEAKYKQLLSFLPADRAQKIKDAVSAA